MTFEEYYEWRNDLLTVLKPGTYLFSLFSIQQSYGKYDREGRHLQKIKIQNISSGMYFKLVDGKLICQSFWTIYSTLSDRRHVIFDYDMECSVDYILKHHPYPLEKIEVTPEEIIITPISAGCFASGDWLREE